MKGVVIQPATDDASEFRFVWACGDCLTASVSHRNARIALADSEDHACPVDPLVSGALDMFTEAPDA